MFVYLISLLSPVYDINPYLDPGSGSFLLQLLLGGIVGLILILKTFWGRIKGFFNNLLGRTAPVAEEQEQDMA